MTKSQKKAMKLAQEVLQYQKVEIVTADDQVELILEHFQDYKDKAEKLAWAIVKMLSHNKNPENNK